MLPNRRPSDSAAAMDKLRGMKFMQRRQEQQRVEAHRAKIQRDAEPAEEETPAPEMSGRKRAVASGPRVISAAAMPVATSQYGRARATYGMPTAVPMAAPDRKSVV